MSHLSSLSVVLQDADRTRDLVTGALAPSAFRRAVHTWVLGGEDHRLPSSSLLFVRVDRDEDSTERPSRREAAATMRMVAELIAPVLRSSDVMGRCDGETLGILLPTTPVLQAEDVCRRLRAVVSTRSESAGQAVTVSVGLASAHDASPWMRAANALGEARRTGRDHTVVAPSLPQGSLGLAA